MESRHLQVRGHNKITATRPQFDNCISRDLLLGLKDGFRHGQKFLQDQLPWRIFEIVKREPRPRGVSHLPLCLALSDYTLILISFGFLKECCSISWVDTTMNVDLDAIATAAHQGSGITKSFIEIPCPAYSWRVRREAYSCIANNFKDVRKIDLFMGSDCHLLESATIFSECVVNQCDQAGDHDLMFMMDQYNMASNVGL
jgi:hypothetical protein